MTRAVALLRSVNVGGTGKLKMAELATAFAKAGYADVQTIVQTGNVVFTCDEKIDAALELRLEMLIAKRFAVTPAVMTRTASEWRAIVAKNPFPDAAEKDPSRFVVMTMKAAPPGAAMKALQARIGGRESVHGVGRHLYIVYPDGQGTTTFTGALIERTLGITGTARNWNTVLKIAGAL